MALLVPTLEDYEKSVEEMTDFFSWIKDEIHWIIYGSFINKKVRLGLSDIDIFILKISKDISFPIWISKDIGEMRDKVERNWIPLQINRQTTAWLKSTTFSPEYNYLMEVTKWIDAWYVSNDLPDLFMENRNKSRDDRDMLRHFARKVNSLWEWLAKVELIVKIQESEITMQNQKDLWKFWDNFKKMLSLCVLAVRVETQESYFARSDQFIMNRFTDIFNPGVDISRYIGIMRSTHDIRDWYSYLKNWWIEELQDIYTDIFIPLINAIDNKLWTQKIQ